MTEQQAGAVLVATTLGLLTRQHGKCMRCGTHIPGTRASKHHRQSRRLHDDSPCNVIVLCGTGTTGCHGWVHAHPAEARAFGWIVLTTQTPAAVGVWSHEHGRRIWLLADYGITLDDQGQPSPADTPDAIAARGALAAAAAAPRPAPRPPAELEAEITRLNARVRVLERELAAERARPAQVRETEILSDERISRLAGILDDFGTVGGELRAELSRAAREAARPSAPVPEQEAGITPGPAAASPGRAVPEPGWPPLRPKERRMLAEIARAGPDGIIRSDLAAAVQLSAAGSSFTAYMSSVARAGLTDTEWGKITLTEHGYAAAQHEGITW